MEPTKQTPTALSDEAAERLRKAALHVPEQYRPAYICLLEHLRRENMELFEADELTEKSRAESYFRHVVLMTLYTENVNPWSLAEMAEAIAPFFPTLQHFTERLQVLGDLYNEGRNTDAVQ